MCVLSPDVVAPYFDKLHTPFDNIIIRIALENKAFKRQKKAWSRWSKKEYLVYREKLNNYISSLKESPSPMKWEFTHWKSEAEMK